VALFQQFSDKICKGAKNALKNVFLAALYRNKFNTIQWANLNTSSFVIKPLTFSTKFGIHLILFIPSVNSCIWAFRCTKITINTVRSYPH